MITTLVSIDTPTTPLDGAWYHPQGRRAIGAVLLFHGNTMNFYTGMLRFLPPALVEMGYACLAFNRRGHDILAIRDSRAAEGGAYQTIAQAVEDNRLAAGQRKLAAMAMGLDARDLPDREAALLAIEATVEMQRAIGMPTCAPCRAPSRWLKTARPAGWRRWRRSMPARPIRGGRGGTGGLSTCIADVVRRMSAAGRKDEMIISGGYNIAPREIEDVLYQNAAVREAAVVGEADPEWGPAVVAYIALRDPAADLGAILEHAKASLGFKRPKRLYGVGELPNNAAGKRQKSALKPALAIRRSETVTRT